MGTVRSLPIRGKRSCSLAVPPASETSAHPPQFTRVQTTLPLSPFRGSLNHPEAPQTQRRREKKRNLVSFSHRSAPGEGFRDPSAHSKSLPDMHFSRTGRPGKRVTRITLLMTHAPSAHLVVELSRREKYQCHPLDHNRREPTQLGSVPPHRESRAERNPLNHREHR